MPGPPGGRDKRANKQETEEPAVPAQIVVVHDDPSFGAALMAGFRAIGKTVTVFQDPTTAWDALKTGNTAEVLVTRMTFGPGQTNGLALARHAVSHRRGIQVLYLCTPAMREHVPEDAVFHVMPVAPDVVVATVASMLEALPPPGITAPPPVPGGRRSRLS